MNLPKALTNLQALSREDLEIALAIAEQLHGQERLAEFITRVTPHHPPPRHIMPLIAEIERARWEQVELCVSMPPRHCKTMTLLNALAWWIECSPADMSAYISYNDDIALSKSRLCRQIAGMAGVRLGGSSDAAGEWTTYAGGGLVASGAAAGLTGRGFQGLVVVDDPYKNREEADSAVINEKIWENFNEVVMTRREGASVIVCHTRWGEHDLIGRLVKEKGWRYLNLAALAEPGDELGRTEGEALWADNSNFSAEKLREIKAQIGEWSFAALYQGRPRPRGHTLFGIETYHDDDSIDGHRIVIYGDPAASKKTTSDYGVMLAMALKGIKHEQTAKVIDLYRAQMTVPEYVRALRAFQQRHNEVPVWVEAVGAFKAVPQMLLEIDPSLRRKIKEHEPVGDKFQRAQGVAAAWNAGRVTVPYGAPWVKDFLAELQNFTGVNDRHDDQVDCLSGAWNAGSHPVPSYGTMPGLGLRTRV